MRASTRFVAFVAIVLAFSNLPNASDRDVSGRLGTAPAQGAIRSSSISSSSHLAIESALTHFARAGRLERHVSLLSALASSNAALPSLRGSRNVLRSSSLRRESIVSAPTRGRAPPVHTSPLNS